VPRTLSLLEAKIQAHAEIPECIPCPAVHVVVVTLTGGLGRAFALQLPRPVKARVGVVLVEKIVDEEAQLEHIVLRGGTPNPRLVML